VLVQFVNHDRQTKRARSTGTHRLGGYPIEDAAASIMNAAQTGSLEK
jgi:hypothetical protein